MKRVSKITVAVAGLGAFLVLGTGACGGGGADDLGPTDAFLGTYWIASFGGDDLNPDEARSVRGTLTSEGRGMATSGNNSRNLNGMVTTLPGGDGPYQADANGGFAFLLGTTPTATGGIADDGRAGMVGATLAPIRPLVFFVARRQGSFSIGSLNGLFHFVLFAYDHQTLDDIARWGTITFDGAGNATVNRSNNVSGLVSSTLPAAGNYFVHPDGAVDFTVVGEPLSGGICEDGNLVLLAGTTTMGGRPTIMILIRGSLAAGLGTLSGSYHAIGMETPVAGNPDWRGMVTTATATGAGALMVNAGLQNEDGAVTALAPVATTYTVAANGALTVAAGNLAGGVSSDGRYAIYAGSGNGGSAPVFWFLLR